MLDYQDFLEAPDGIKQQKIVEVQRDVATSVPDHDSLYRRKFFLAAFIIWRSIRGQTDAPPSFNPRIATGSTRASQQTTGVERV